jgi:hypothetical protein
MTPPRMGIVASPFCWGLCSCNFRSRAIPHHSHSPQSQCRDREQKHRRHAGTDQAGGGLHILNFSSVFPRRLPLVPHRLLLHLNFVGRLGSRKFFSELLSSFGVGLRCQGRGNAHVFDSFGFTESSVQGATVMRSAPRLILAFCWTCLALPLPSAGATEEKDSPQLDNDLRRHV